MRKFFSVETQQISASGPSAIHAFLFRRRLIRADDVQIQSL